MVQALIVWEELRQACYEHLPLQSHKTYIGDLAIDRIRTMCAALKVEPKCDELYA